MLERLLQALPFTGAAVRTDAALRPVAGRNLLVERGGRVLLEVGGIVLAGSGLTAVMGPNGAGKSLLLRVLAGLVRPDRGEVRWGDGVPGRDRATRLGFVFQKPVMLRRSAEANVRYALAAAGCPAAGQRALALAALDGAGLAHLAGIPARALSGGEQQRLALARALAIEPEVLFLDEPTASVDPASTAAIEAMVGEARRRGTKTVLVTHDIGQARRLADEVVFMHQGTIAERAPAVRFFAAPRSEPARAYLEGRICLDPAASTE